jgi:hypothetical protein
MINRLLKWIYFWMALTGPDGQPSQRKILTGLALVCGCAAMLWIGAGEFRKVLAGGALSADYVWLVAVVIAGATGHSILRDKTAPSDAFLRTNGRASGAIETPPEPKP